MVPFGYFYSPSTNTRVEKDHLLQLARHFSSLSQADAHVLGEWQKEFPYSQVVHHLAARAAQDLAIHGRERLLHLSAVYASDRALLRQIMLQPRTWPQGNGSLAETAIPPSIAIAGNDTRAGDDLLQEVMTDLRKLKKLKENFERAAHQFDERKKPGRTTAKKVIKPRPAPKKSKQRKSRTGPVSEHLLEEIKTSKKKIKPGSRKQKAQLEIIDQFIKKQPSIPKIKSNSPPVKDLSEKSVALSDNLVSETLVELLIRQGKKEKAVEMLKKLIWKFPRKKAIFAARIETLKK